MGESVVHTSKSAPPPRTGLNHHEPTAPAPPILTKTPEDHLNLKAHPHASGPFGVGGFIRAAPPCSDPGKGCCTAIF